MIRATVAAAVLMLSSVASQVGQIQTKPVLCGTPEEAFNTINSMGQTKIYEALQVTTVKAPEGYAPDPVLLPFMIYMNLDAKTYTIIEYHPAYNQYCLISFGREGNFVNE